MKSLPVELDWPDVSVFWEDAGVFAESSAGVRNKVKVRIPRSERSSMEMMSLNKIGFVMGLPVRGKVLVIYMREGEKYVGGMGGSGRNMLIFTIKRFH